MLKSLADVKAFMKRHPGLIFRVGVDAKRRHRGRSSRVRKNEYSKGLV